MSERVRTEVPPASLAEAPSIEDVRRQLEGRLETVEAARERYAALESLLSGKKWKRRLNEQPGTLQSVRDQEPVLGEALERVLRRAETERWPEALPVLATVRQVRALRERVEWLVQKRLGELAPGSGAWSLTEGLTRLEGLVPPPVSLELSEGEVLLSEGTASSGSWRWLYGLFGLSMLMFVGAFMRSGLQAALFMGTVMAVARLVLERWWRGRYRLTSERLVWAPAGGEPVQLPLRSIAGDGVRFSFRGLRVVGEREVFIQGNSQELARLTDLLELHRHPPLLGGVEPGRKVNAVCYPAKLEVGSSSRAGYAVLRPGYVAFFPRDTGSSAVLSAIIGRNASLAMTTLRLPTLIEQLRFLSMSAAFDACMERAVAASGGELWRTGEVLRYEPHTPVLKRLHFQTIDRPQKSLIGKVARGEQARTEDLLADWPKR